MRDATGTIRTADLRSEPYSQIPGDQRRVLLVAATDETGHVWPAGTVFTPLCGGSDGTEGTYHVPNPHGAGLIAQHVLGRYVEVTIEGQRVTFRF